MILEGKSEGGLFVRVLGPGALQTLTTVRPRDLLLQPRDAAGFLDARHLPLV